MALNKKDIDYGKIAASEEFRNLAKRKNAFLWTITAIFLIVYMMLPVLTSFTTILHQKAIGDITWVWIYSLGLFIMTWSLAHFYVHKANSYDKQAAKLISDYEGGTLK